MDIALNRFTQFESPCSSVSAGSGTTSEQCRRRWWTPAAAAAARRQQLLRPRKPEVVMADGQLKAIQDIRPEIVLGRDGAHNAVTDVERVTARQAANCTALTAVRCSSRRNTRL